MLEILLPDLGKGGGGGDLHVEFAQLLAVLYTFQ